MKKSSRILFFSALMVLTCAFSLSLIACGETPEDPDPDVECTDGTRSEDESQLCMCTDARGELCTQGDEGCSCDFESPWTNQPTTDGNCDHLECPEPTAAQPYRFVMIEDLASNISSQSESPGADLDAVVVTRAEGTELPATSVEDFDIDTNGVFQDPTQILGTPDSDCEVKNFVALGGKEAGGFIILGFSTDDDDGSFGGGASITVHEIGSTMCPNQTYDDDPYRVSVSISTDRGTFTEIATDVTGNSPIIVPTASESQSQELREQGLSCACP